MRQDIHTSRVSQSDVLVNLCVVHPMIQCFKSLLLAVTSSDVCRTSVLSSKLLEYMQRFPRISVGLIEPLLSLSSGKVIYIILRLVLVFDGFMYRPQLIQSILTF